MTRWDFARALETLGVDMIEAGFAGASPGDFEAVRAVARHGQNRRVLSGALRGGGISAAAADALKGAAKPRHPRLYRHQPPATAPPS